MQQERALSLLALGGDRQAAAGMQAQRSKTNTSLGELSVLAGVVHDLNPDAVAKSNAEFAELAARLPVVRQGVDQLLASPVDVDDFYSQLAEVVIVVVAKFRQDPRQDRGRFCYGSRHHYGRCAHLRPEAGDVRRARRW